MQVDMTALKQMGENDLKELGIPMVTVFPFSFFSFMEYVHLFSKDWNFN